MVVRQHAQTRGRGHGRGRGPERGSGALASAVTAGAVASLMFATAGCAGGGAAASDQPGAVDPAEATNAVRRAALVLTDEGSAVARTSMETATGGTRVTIRGEGAYDFRKRTGRLTVLLPQDPAGVDKHRPITELFAPGALYMKNRGAGVPADKWVRIDTAALSDGNLVTGGATDPMAAAELLRGAREVTYVGEKKLVDGTRVRHYRGTADLGRAAELAAAENQKVFEAAAKGFAKATVPFDAYLDDEGRLRKIRHRFSVANQDAGRSAEAMAVVSTTVLYRFGAPVRAQLPKDEDIFAGQIAER
ncbi:hypothetical protein [Streptomyces sp. NPDC002851]